MMMSSSQSCRYGVLLLILASSHSFSVTTYRSCPFKCNNNNNHNRHSKNKNIVGLQLLNNDLNLDQDRRLKTESNQLAKVQSIAVGTNDKRQYYYSILLLLSLLSCLK